MKVKKIKDKELSWKPFGQRMTMAEWEDVVTEFVQRDLDRRLNKEEDNA